MRPIDADKIVFCYGGLNQISPQDFAGIARYFLNQIKEAPTLDCDYVVPHCGAKMGGDVKKCSELRRELDQTEMDLLNTRRSLGDRMDELNDAETALEQARKLIATMKADLLLAASGYCCGICARKAECADAAQVTCCSAFRYYKMEG